MTRPSLASRARWVLCMAWRDSRGSRAALLFSVAAVALGLGGLVAIRSFGDRMESAIQNHTRELLGADIALKSIQPFTGALLAEANRIPGEQIHETQFLSMAVFPDQDKTRLCQVRAMDGPFPFYGAMETEPPEAAHIFLRDRHTALVEDTLLIQMKAEVGDRIRVGGVDFTIAGRLLHIAGDSPAAAMLTGPRVFINSETLADTELIGKESLARHTLYYRLPPTVSAEHIQRKHQKAWSRLRIRSETAEERRALMGHALTHLYRFLNLSAMVALLLGGAGLAGSIQMYVRKKKDTVSVLRCLGADARTAFMIYVAQALFIALIGAGLGAIGGTLFQYALPYLLADFLPVQVQPGWSPASMLLSVAFGLALSIAFALLPLLPLRHIPPLAALHSSDAPPLRRWDALRIGVWAGLIALLLAFSVLHTERWIQGVAFTMSLGTTLILLWLTARGLMAMSRRLLSPSWPFELRQGLANLYRPGNQTVVLLLCLGLGAFLLGTLSFTQHNLTRQFSSADRDDQPNVILFDVQPDQVTDIERLVQAQGMEVMETAPIVTMRLASIKGIELSALRNNKGHSIPSWALFREYRSSYREILGEREKITSGTWHGRVTDLSRAIPISLEEGIAETLGVGVGDRLEFDIQGVRFQTVVASLRNVDWRQMRTNFFVLFPAGVLEQAPQYYALVTRAPSAEASALLQNTVVRDYPHVSAIDLRIVVDSIDRVFDKAAFVIRFMALFSAVTGLVVLSGAVVSGRFDRLSETTLLRTLGATRKQLNRIMTAEYVLLGGLACGTGLLLAWAAAWALAKGVFNMAFTPAWQTFVVLPLAIMAATWLVGHLSNRDIRSTSRAS